MHVAGSSGLGRGRALAALHARLLLFALFVLALAEPRAVRADDRLSVIFAVDHSSSITPRAGEQALQYVLDAVEGKPEDDEAGLLFFGRNAAVELPPAMSLPFEAVNVQLDRDGTDLSNALSLGAAMLPPERQGRVVLISDGVETEGHLGTVLDDLRSRDIPVDVLPIDYRYEHEVWLERLELPRFLKLGETFEAAVILSSLKEGSGRLVLVENEQVVFAESVQFNAGKNRFVVPIHLTRPGFYEYRAEVEVPPERDSWTRNNVAISQLYIEGQGMILVVTDPEGDARDEAPLVDALVRSRRQVQVASAYSFPRERLALLPYDCIVFVNVPRDALDEVQIQAAHDAVYTQGSGFLMLGGQNGFGPGGYHRTQIEDLLPVTMDISQKKVLPKGALAIVLHTCEFPEGNTWGKRITKQAMKVLNPRDEVGVLVFDYQGSDKWLFPLTPAQEYERLAQLVNNAEIGDMPGFSPSMRMGLTGLQASDAATRHMIIISDGDPSPPPPKLVEEFVAAKVSISMIAIAPHGSSDIDMMRSVAGTTGGRFYFPPGPAALPAIFIKEAKTLRRSSIQNLTFVPQVELSSPVLKGLGELPSLHGYVLTTPKPRSTVILEGPEQEDMDPVLVTWRYGVGAAAAFTSDLSSNWGRDWVGWERYRAFVNQLVTEISRVKEESWLHVQSYAAGGEGVILVEDHAAQEALLSVQAQVQGPNDASSAVTLEQVGPRRYEGRFALGNQGRYQVLVAALGEGRDERAHAGFVVPYSDELRRFRANPSSWPRSPSAAAGACSTGTRPVRCSTAHPGPRGRARARSSTGCWRSWPA